MAGYNCAQTPEEVSKQSVQWVLENVSPAEGFLTPTVNSLLHSLRGELNALGEISTAEDSYLLNAFFLAKTPSAFPKGMVDEVLTVPKAHAFEQHPVWMMMTEYVRAKMGKHADVLPDPFGQEYEEGRAAIEKWDRIVPSYRHLVEGLMERSQSLVETNIQRLHGHHLTMYRTLVVGQGIEEPLRHKPLSAWTEDKGFAEGWKSGQRRLLLTASVPADCAWIAPGYAEGEWSSALTPQRVTASR